MRILLVTGKLTYSNPTTYAIELVRGLMERGHEVRVASLGGLLTGDVAQLGVEVFQIRYNVFGFRRLVQFLREFDPEIIHETGGQGALRAGKKLSRQLDRPLIHTCHSWLPEDRDARLPSNLAGIIVVNQSLREHLVNDRRFPKDRIRVIPYGVDAAGIPSELPADEEKSPEQTHPVVGVIGRLDRGRRHDEFIRAAAKIRETREDVHFVLAGEGPDEERLRALVKKLDLLDSVTFVQPQRGSREIYHVLDVMVVVADWGGVGLNLLEGMACQRPVIATGGAEVFSILGEEGICELVPAGDVEAMASAISELLDDPEKRIEYGSRAREFVIKNFPLDAQISRVEETYEQVLASTVL